MKSKKILRLSAFVIPLFLVGVIIYLYSNYQKKKQQVIALQTIPSFSLITIEGQSFTNINLINDRNKIFVYFSPSCHFCQAEAEELSKTYQQYPNIQWIWVASEPVEEIKQFAVKYQLDKQNNIYWCHDEMATLYQKLAMNSVPYFLTYNKENQLVKRKSGVIKLEKLTEDF